jgi:hypothetical protein
MDHPLLLLKFHVPQLKSNLVARHRLLGIFNEDLKRS